MNNQALNEQAEAKSTVLLKKQMYKYSPETVTYVPRIWPCILGKNKMSFTTFIYGMF